MVIPTSIAESALHSREILKAHRTEATKRAVARTATAPSPEASARTTSSSSDRLLVAERNHRFYFLEASAVDYMEVDGNYVTIHVGGECFLVRATLKHLSAHLAASDFVRIDRSCLVNLRRVEYAERLEGGEFAFTLRCGQRVVSSRERASGILKLLRSAAR